MVRSAQGVASSPVLAGAGVFTAGLVFGFSVISIFCRCSSPLSFLFWFLCSFSWQQLVSFSIFRVYGSLFWQLLLFPFQFRFCVFFGCFYSFVFVCIVAALLRFLFLVVGAESVGVGVFCLGFGWFLVGHVDLVRNLWCW